MHLIVTRPEPDASRTAEELAALGHQPILSPMLDIILDPAASLPAADFQAVVVTSSNAVRALAAHPGGARLRALPLIAVGDASALEASQAGFSASRSAGGALGDLVALVRAQLEPGAGPLLYAAGDVQAGDLAGCLGALGFAVQTAIVYRSQARGGLSLQASLALQEGQADGVLLHSPRSAAAFADAVAAGPLTPLSAALTCLCISSRTADAVRRVVAGPVLIAARPNQASLFALLDEVAQRRPAEELPPAQPAKE